MKSALPALVLTGCTSAFDPMPALSGYAEVTELGGELSAYLSETALVSALQTEQLKQSLGLTQVGRASFEIESVLETNVVGCLDLSSVVVLDPAGAPIESERENRLVFRAAFDSAGKISQFDVSEETC